MDETIVKMAQVESVEDTADGLRIKARLSQDGAKPLDEIPYAFPLLPKTFQTVPKVGEGVFILNAKVGNAQSNRYYIGPIISQPQFQEYDTYDYGRGSSISLLDGGPLKPLERISNYAETNGAFPSNGDVAVVGRKSEDIILKDGEIDLRCGIRGENIGIDALKGNVSFNNVDPSYIQLRYGSGLTKEKGQEANSVVNVVADKINLISHKDENSFNLTDPSELIKKEELDEIMKQLHQVPYGDILVDVLKKIISAVTNHVHPYPGLPPCRDQYITTLTTTDVSEILSPNIRTS